MYYFDYAASTPVEEEVIEVMNPYLSEKYGNPGSLHSYGQASLEGIDNAREILVKSFGLSSENNFRSVIFTGSATEANNLALRGVIKRLLRYARNDKGDVIASDHRERGDLVDSKNQSLISKPKIIISAIEHESIIDTARLLEKEGIDIAIIPVNKEGVIDLEKLKEEINNQTVLVSIMYVNNELVTIQPIKEIAEIIKNYKSENNSTYPLFHSDAVQAFQLIDCNVEDLGVDLMTISAHKIYGPKGIGALYVKSLDTLSPIITGGGQEFNLRSGTQNTSSIIGFGKAVELTLKFRDKERKRLQELSSYFWKEVKSNFPKAQLNGPAVDSSVRLPHILNISFPGNKSEEMLIKLDMAGVAVSTGSACSARSIKESHVLQAINLPYNIRNSSLRFSFGRPTTKEQVEELVEILKKTI